MRLQTKISLYVVAVMLVVGGLGAAAVYTIQKRASTHQFEETTAALTATILNGLEQDMIRGDRDHVQQTLDSLSREETVHEIDIVSASTGNIWASTDPATIGRPTNEATRQLLAAAGARNIVNDTGDGMVSVSAPIVANGNCLQCHGSVADPPNAQGLLGAVRVNISAASLDRSVTRSYQIILLLGGLTAIFLGGSIVFTLRRSVLSPLGRLTGAAARISDGDYAVRVPVNQRGDELDSVSIAFNDMAEKVAEHTSRLEEANLALDRANRTKSEFLANMSHELRTPLNVIIGFSEVLRDTPPESLSGPDRREFCDNIITSGYHLLELINDVLDLAKVEAGRMKFTPVEFLAAPALSDTVATMQPLAAKKNISLSVQISGRLSSIYADAGKFKQIVYNLAGNAVKFTPPGGEVRVSGAVMGPFARFAVADNGVGISSADQERIFSEFQQVDGSTSRQYEGTGLGLALSRKFVELMGGRIWVESSPGKGSTFYFTLPLPAEKTLPAPITVERKAAAHVNEDRQEDAWPGFPGKEESPGILVVEDDPKTAKLIGLWLSQEGYRVDYAADGYQALEKASASLPFAVCLDIMLPRKDGWQVLHQLKSNPETADIGVIICSALDNPDLGFALGAADFCLKPLSRRHLLDKLKHLQQVTPGGRSRPQVLVADADDAAARATVAMLERQGFSVIRAAGAQQARDMALEHSPDIIILDLQLPEGGGYDVLSFLQKHPVTVDIPVIVTSDKALSDRERDLLSSHVEKIIPRGDARESLMREIFRLEKLHPERARLLDPETRVFNRRYFEKRLAEELARAERHSLDLSVLLIEMDTAEGRTEAHSAMLEALAGTLRRNIRAADPLARYDDSRFAVLLPETPRDAGLKAAQKMVDLVRGQQFRDDAGASFTFTLNVAVTDSHCGSVPAAQIAARLEQGIEEIRQAGGGEARLT